MKRFAYLFSLTTFAIFIAFAVMTSCEGPAGQAGMDANETCKVCHNDNSDMLAKQIQAANSVHMTGTAFERNAADCAACHTHEGFTDRMASGEMEASGSITDPTPPNCRTCHNVHNAYDSTDWSLTYKDPVTLWAGGATVDLGVGNICANCHQARLTDPLLVKGGSDLTITSNRWGPHHGTQSSNLWGTGGYELAGTESYGTPGSFAHAKAEGGCTKCHMAEAFGAQAGGHTFNMTYESHGSEADNIVACTGCHSSATKFDIAGVQTEVEELIDSLHNVLMDKGWVDASGLLVAKSTAPLVLTADQAGAVYNFLFIEEDRSLGVHNPPYIKALLKNSIAFASK